MVLWRAHGNAKIVLLCWRGGCRRDQIPQIKIAVSGKFFQRGIALSSSQPSKIMSSDANLHPSSLFSLCAVFADVDEGKEVNL